MANDADAAAFGEFKAGAGRGSEHMIAITLGTGLGSGIIIHSKLYTGFAYGGAEFGHSLLVKDGAALHLRCAVDAWKPMRLQPA